MAAAVLRQFMPFMNQSRNRSSARVNLTETDGGTTVNGDGTMTAEGDTEDGAADVSEDDNVTAGQEEPDDYVASESDAEAPANASSSKSRSTNRRGSRRKHRAPSQAAVESDASAAAESSDSSEEDEDEDNGGSGGWEAESEADKDTDANMVDPSSCIYCGETEDNDPSEEYEEYLACSVCGDNAHRQCARDSGSLKADEEAASWTCGSCLDTNLEESVKEDDIAERRRSAAQKLTRDLLPAHRGSIKPGSHSVFNKLILDDDPMDGSRSLRKRKSSNEMDERQEPARKRERRRTLEPSKSEEAVFDNEISNAVAEVEETNTPRVRPARSRGQRRTGGYLAMVIQSTEDSLIMSFKIDHSKLATEKRKQKRRDREKARRAQAIQMISEEETSHYPALQTSSFTHFYAFNDSKDGEEVKSKPYGGILSEQEADTTKTFPQASDRKRFEDVRLKAEADWRDKLRQAAATEPLRASQKVSGPPSKIKCINFGSHEIDTWHAAPYPEEYSRNKVLYICEFCLKYMNSDYVAWRHKLKCPAKHPPGDEIYRDGQFSFFEVDGRKNPVYCQNLCLLAKLFLGSKTLYYDVEPFLFYIMTENDEYGCHFVGYFSKEKRPSSQNNVSCILVLPIHQRRGFGHMLIDFSYMLTKVEQKTGSPEKPLSDMGLVSYRSYWRLVLCSELLDQKEAISITEISERTGMTADDIVCALEGLRALVRDPLTKTYALRLDFPFFRQYIENHERKGYAKLNPESLIWVPYVMGRDNMHYEHAPPLHTVAQRDEDADASDEAQLATSGVSETDYGKSTKNIVNGQDVSSGADVEMTPFPALSTEQESGFVSRSRRSPLRTTSSASTTLINGSDRSDDMAPIPATRFEVYPPLPFARKRGRPPGSRTRNRSSPYTRVRPSSFGGASPSTAHGPSSLRRSRTALDYELGNADGNAESAEELGADEPGPTEEDQADADAAADLGAEVDAEGDDDESASEVEGNESSEEEEEEEESEADEVGEDVDAEGSPDPDA